MTGILERNGLVVYEDGTSRAHIPPEDLKLALGNERYEHFLDFVSGRTVPIGGFYPSDVEEFLYKFRWS